jgi:hypothetical protein
MNRIEKYQACIEPLQLGVLYLFDRLLNQLSTHKPPLTLKGNHPFKHAKKEKYSTSFMSIKICFIILNCAVRERIIIHHY